MSELYHYTCQHGREGIGDRGTLILPSEVKKSHLRNRLYGPYAELDGLIWMTDLDSPVRSGLGLTRVITSCDRTEHRYRVVDQRSVVRYVAMRRSLNPLLARLLESAPGAMPMHWWVSAEPVPVEYMPAGGEL